MAQPEHLFRLAGENRSSRTLLRAGSRVRHPLGCAMDYSCTKLWSELVPTADPRVRTCLDCKSPVALSLPRTRWIGWQSAAKCVAYLSQEGLSPNKAVGLRHAGDLGAFRVGL